MMTQPGRPRHPRNLASIRPALRSRPWNGLRPALRKAARLLQNHLLQHRRRGKSNATANDHHSFHQCSPLTRNFLRPVRILPYPTVVALIFFNISCSNPHTNEAITPELRHACVTSGVIPDDAALRARLVWFQHARADGMDRATAFRTVMQAMADRSWNHPSRKFDCQTCLLLLIDAAYGPTPPASASPAATAATAD